MNLSTHPAPLPHHLSHSLPVCKKLWVPLHDTAEPMCRAPVVAPQPLIFAAGPADQNVIEMLPKMLERRRIKPSVVLEPPANDGVVLLNLNK